MKRYPEYKNSGVDWIGKIPRHWDVKRLKYVAKILPSNVDKHIYPDEIQVRLCNYTDVYYNDYVTVDTVLEKVHSRLLLKSKVEFLNLQNRQI